MRLGIIERTLCALVGLLLVASGDGDGIPGPATTTVSSTSTSQGNAPPSNVPRCVNVTDPLDNVPDFFYELRGPASSTAAPGDLICSNEITAPRGDRAWVFLYWARLGNGSLVQVSGTLVISTAIPDPPARRPVLSWAHDTPSSITDGCAPSRAAPRPLGLGGYPPLLRRFLNAGFAVVATDYIGLGTPGVHPYMVGKSEGAAVLAAARAAQNFSPAQALGPVIVMGHSQGGHAALWASYQAQLSFIAPELDVRGVIALAPPTNLLEMARSVLTNLSGSSREARGNLLIVAGSWRQVYDLEYPGFLSDEAIAVANYETDANTQECRRLQASHVRGLDNMIQAGRHPELPIEWSNQLEVNSVPATHLSRTIPLLIVQGKEDEQVPYLVTLAAVQDICESGVPVQFDKIAGGDHGAPVRSLSADRLLLPWVQRRIRGDVENNCASMHSSAPPLTMYTVRQGDTLWDLAQTFHIAGGWKELYHLNSDIITDADLIHPGQHLFIH